MSETDSTAVKLAAAEALAPWASLMLVQMGDPEGYTTEQAAAVSGFLRAFVSAKTADRFDPDRAEMEDWR